MQITLKVIFCSELLSAGEAHRHAEGGLREAKLFESISSK